MTLRHRLALIAATTFLAGCHASPPAAVPLSGEAGALASLAGEWTGSYQGSQTGRSGSIVFTLVTGEDHAHGDVVMIPRGGNGPLRPHRAMPGVMMPDTAGPQVLRIDFVRASGDSVSGILDTYLDPDCGCPVMTTFVGRVHGKTIRGTFTSRRAQGTGTVGGTWRVDRR